MGKCCDRRIEVRTDNGRASGMEVLLVMTIDSLGQGLLYVCGWQRTTGMVIELWTDHQVEEGIHADGLPQGIHVGLLKAAVRLLLPMGSRTRNRKEGRMR